MNLHFKLLINILSKLIEYGKINAFFDKMKKKIYKNYLLYFIVKINFVFDYTFTIVNSAMN